jgi:hypothetical protein
MRLPRGFLIVGLLLGFASLTGVLILSREPSYGGVSLGEWVDRLGSSDQTERETARVAVRQIGGEAVPHLLRMLRKEDSAIKIKLVQLLAKQSIVHVRFSWSAQQHERAVRGFQALGPAAKDALLPLVAVLNNTNARAAQMAYGISCFPNAPAAQRALEALGVDVMLAAIPLVTNDMCQRWLYRDLIFMDFLYGDDLHRVVPVIERILEECKFPDIRADAAARLGSSQRWPNLEIAILTRSLILDADVTVKQKAASALSYYESRATNAVPALLWARSIPGVREAAIGALRLIDPNAAADFDTGLRKAPDWPAEYLPLPAPL